MGGMRRSALGPQHWKGMPSVRGIPPPGCTRQPAALGLAAEEEEDLEEEGVGGGRGPGSGPRPRRARSAILPRSSPMLIFGLGCQCPGISRHASRRPVRRPEPGRKGGRLGQRRRRRRRRLPGTFMSPRRTLPRPLSLCVCLSLCLAAVAAREAAQSGEFGAPSPPRLCPQRPDPAKLRCDPDLRSPESAGSAPFSLLRGPPPHLVS